ncbi:MAG: putative Ig domain-containing protein, partial [Lentimicrobiaceae bacterium]|nr:putative Ig domain-containing protein [Lentimicrobiaceae bacterium]
ADGDEPITWSVIDGSLPTGLSLDGATGVISGTPSAEGNFTFTVEALNNYAADTKELTIRINSVGISNYKLGIINYSVYPNPTTGKITVKCAETLHATSVQVFDVVGRTVGAYRIRPENTETVIDISHLANGMYFLKIDGKILKVVKE